MLSLRKLAAWAAIFAVCVSPVPALGAAKDAVLNKEGYWGIDVDGPACAASMTLQGGSTFLLRAQDGRLTFGLFARAPMAPAKTGRIETEAYSVDFAPSYINNNATMFFRNDLDARAIAALRLARQVRIFADGKPVAAMTLEGTGFEGALDGVLACSRGQAGWWGPGVAASQAGAKHPPGGLGEKAVLNKEGIWLVGPEGEVCFASAPLKVGGWFMLKAKTGNLSFGIDLDRAPPKGKRGSFQTEAYAFDFQPSYTKDGLLYFRENLGANVIAALRLARDLRVSVDGREVMGVHLEGTGLDGVLDALTQCSTGKSGWWGAGAKLASAHPRPTPRDDPPTAHGGGGSGSAFFISADGVAVTAAHVVKDCVRLESPRWGAVKVLAADPQSDLAVLKTSGASGEFVALRIRGPKLGEAMSAAGYPLGQLLGSGLKVTTGVVSGLSGPGGDRGLFQLSAPIQPGNSGGPVIDAAGALIGVASAKLDELELVEATGVFPQNVNFAVPVTVLQSFLDENGVAYKAAEGPAGPAAALTSYTFSIVCSR
ncbi:MAG: S1C family serine protease [Phenylobacterium sp.]